MFCCSHTDPYTDRSEIWHETEPKVCLFTSNFTVIGAWCRPCGTKAPQILRYVQIKHFVAAPPTDTETKLNTHVRPQTFSYQTISKPFLNSYGLMMTPLVQTWPFLLSKSVFVFLVFSSLIFCVIFSSLRQIKLAYASLRTHVNIAYRIVSYRTGQKRVTVKKQRQNKNRTFSPRQRAMSELCCTRLHRGGPYHYYSSLTFPDPISSFAARSSQCLSYAYTQRACFRLCMTAYNNIWNNISLSLHGVIDTARDKRFSENTLLNLTDHY